ncbi:hypothetical protein D1231_16020 [Henriciella mobilis]|nr:hypothetical protein D1231_16020 [Henriciella mobilis]
MFQRGGMNWSLPLLPRERAQGEASHVDAPDHGDEGDWLGKDRARQTGLHPLSPTPLPGERGKVSAVRRFLSA